MRQSLPRRANFGSEACCAPDSSDGYYRLAPIGQYPDGVSPFGLLDMAGNVWEWTASRFPGKPDHVVLRGGGWGNNPYCLRVSYRHGNPPVCTYAASNRSSTYLQRGARLLSLSRWPVFP